jgi:hypothetical protein
MSLENHGSNDAEQLSTDDLNAGDRVVDRDADPDDQNPAIVVELPEDPAYACEIPSLDASVADVNPDYPASGAVAIVAFERSLNDALDNWRIAAVEALPAVCEEWEVQTYTYPVARLAREGGDGA